MADFFLSANLLEVTAFSKKSSASEYWTIEFAQICDIMHEICKITRGFIVEILDYLNKNLIGKVHLRGIYLH